MSSIRNESATTTIDLGGAAVHRLGFGTMQLTGSGVWGPPPDRRQAIAVLRRVVELGVQFIDTADSYGPWVAENLIREALNPYPTTSSPRPRRTSYAPVRINLLLDAGGQWRAVP